MDHSPGGGRRQSIQAPGRRGLIASGIAGGVVLASGLVVRNQIRHPHKNKRPPLDGRSRHLVLAAAGFDHDPVLLAARDQGVFARYNLDVSFVQRVASARAAIDAVRAGTADGAVAPALSWLPRMARGALDARLVCGLQSGSARLLVARGSPMHRIEDLYRHAIGIADADGPDRLFFSIVMRRKGMNPERDVEWRIVPPEALGLALAENQVQAIVGHDPVIWKLRQALQLQELASSIEGSYGARVSRVLGLSGRVLAADPRAAVAITLAVQEAATWVAAHLAQVGVLVAERDPDLTLDQARHMLRAEGHDVHPVGLNLRNQVAQYVDELKLLGVVAEDIDSTEFSNRVTANVLKA